YMKILFQDDFTGDDMRTAFNQYKKEKGITQSWSPEFVHINFPKKEKHESFFGGYDAVFLPGKTVLDLGSGQAVGLMQLSEKHPETTFIGIDQLYQEKRKIYPKKPGLQLTHADWNSLEG